MLSSRLSWAALLSVVALLGAGALIFLYAPPDALQGQVQRIFYLHVASALAAYLCFALVLAGSLAYLWGGSSRADRLARSAAPVGLVFTSVVLVMGSLWAKPIWGTFWTWDARLTSTAAMWIVYAGYLVARRLASDETASARVGAAIGIVGFVTVPIVHFSVTWWRTLHPRAVLENPRGPQLPPEMLITFLATLVAVLLFAIVLVAVRYRVELLREELAALSRQPERARVPAAPARLTTPVVR